MKKLGLFVAVCGTALVMVWSAHSANARSQLPVELLCANDKDTLNVQALFPKERLVLRVTCEVKSHECDGAYLRLGALESGKPLGVLDLGAIDTATVTFANDHEAQIKSRANHVKVNFETGVVTYNDSMTGSCRQPKVPISQ